MPSPTTDQSRNQRRTPRWAYPALGFVLFVLAMILTVPALIEVRRSAAALEFVEVSASISASEYSSGRGGGRLKCSYFLEFGGKSFFGEFPPLDSSLYSGPRDPAGWVRTHGPGSSCVAYVNPQNPADHVLFRGAAPEAGILVALGGFLAGVGVVMISCLWCFESMWTIRVRPYVAMFIFGSTLALFGAMFVFLHADVPPTLTTTAVAFVATSLPWFASATLGIWAALRARSA